METKPLKRSASFRNISRRDSSSATPIVSSWVQPELSALALRSLRGQPGDDVRHLLRGHRPPRDVAAPVRRAQIGPAGNHGGAKALVAHEGEVGLIDNRAGARTAAAISTVT